MVVPACVAAVADCVMRQARPCPSPLHLPCISPVSPQYLPCISLYLRCISQVISLAFRRLAKQWHPDRWAGGSEAEQAEEI